MERIYRRVYIRVSVEFDETGRMRPRELTWEDGRRYGIDRVLDVRPAAAQKSGGQGDRYTVLIRGRRRELFFEHPARPAASPGRWFVEAASPGDL